MTVKDALTMGRKVLVDANIANSFLDSELLLAHVLEKDRTKLLTDIEQNLTWRQVDHYRDLLTQRCQNIPIAYITGRKEFYGLNFYVRQGALIPRPETEFVVDEILNTIHHIKNPVIADLCSGIGPISIAVAVNNSDVRVYATEISDVAYNLAKSNIELHQVDDRIFLFQGDLWDPLQMNNIRKLHVVAANPPYIPTSDLALLPKDVKHEPQIALNGGQDGLKFYKRIASKVREFLKPNGKIVFEIGWNQAKDVGLILKKAGFKDIKVTKDYTGLDRVVSGLLV